jgi:hypothetical protein
MAGTVELPSQPRIFPRRKAPKSMK